MKKESKKSPEKQRSEKGGGSRNVSVKKEAGSRDASVANRSMRKEVTPSVRDLKDHSMKSKGRDSSVLS